MTPMDMEIIPAEMLLMNSGSALKGILFMMFM